jgi:thiosulfate dehydrogenase
MNKSSENSAENTLLLNIESIIYLLIITLLAIIFCIYQIFNVSGEILPWPKDEKNEVVNLTHPDTILYNATSETYWQAPDEESIKGSALEPQILYGKDLIQNTARYLGPKGSVAQISNGMNCQNCHLNAGTKIFGNNYGSVASTFPKFRARSGTEENIYKRVNDCFERSLNGMPLDTMSEEMQAIKAYMLFLGKNVKKGTVVKGSGLKNVPLMDRAADPDDGKTIYTIKCASCHQADGGGVKAADGIVYTYPPLWGKNSYNDAAGLYRLSNLTKYVKYNMPLGATFEAPQLSDEEAWDVAAYINTQPRYHKNTPNDWPDISKKPVDHPYGPYSDSFDESQHKYGPFIPIADAHKKK